MSDKPYPENPGRTHYEGCWAERGHCECARAEVERLRARLGVAEGQRDDRRRETRQVLKDWGNDRDVLLAEVKRLEAQVGGLRGEAKHHALLTKDERDEARAEVERLRERAEKYEGLAFMAFQDKARLRDERNEARALLTIATDRAEAAEDERDEARADVARLRGLLRRVLDDDDLDDARECPIMDDIRAALGGE